MASSDANAPNEDRPELTFSETARRLGADIIGPPADFRVLGVTTVEEARAGWIAFVGHPRYLASAQASSASGFIVTPETVVPERPCIVLDNVWKGVIFLLEQLQAPPAPPALVHPTAVLGSNVSLGENVSIGPHAVIEDHVAIGAGAQIGAQCFIGHHSRIGEGARLHPRVCVQYGCEIGARAVLHPGVVIGADGFKYEVIDGRWAKIPQVGRVVVEDDVEIGANTCIDRASFTETRVCRGTKIDNLCQIAHNVRIGAGSILVSQVGIAGSSRIGEGCILAGQVGVADNLTIGDGAKVGAQAGVKNDLPGNAFYLGAPAVPVREFAGQLADVKKIPDIRKRLRDLDSRLAALEKRLPQPE